ncbi:MAG: aryl-sulfate sulfotransferase [Bacteroidetes bacterium]|nr:aryl-sulfate sulfotransferase [Bacteroidota bacterium]
MASASGQSYDGYTFYFPQNGTKAYLIDLSGSTYHQWTFSSQTTYASYLLSGGVVLRTVNHPGNSFNGGPISGEVQKVDYNGNILWDFVYSTTNYCTHHDICAMPNGNVLLIAYERKTPAEVTQAGCSQSIEMWPDKIVEIQPSGTNGGTVVWEWHAWDHLVQEYDVSKNNYGAVATHPELLNINYITTKDWMHVNGIDFNEQLNQITFSSHSLNEVYVIDHSTTTAQAASHAGGNSGKGGDFLYRWGNPQAYQAPGSADFNVVHDAHWVPMSSPRFPNSLCGYNNKGGAGNKTCIDIFTPPYNGYNYLYTPGNAYAPSTYNWRHTYSGNQQPDNGNSQQLPNGNTLVCAGMNGFIYEIDSNQIQVWSKTVGGTIAQSFRYPPCYVTGTYSATASATPSSLCYGGGSSQLDVSITGGVAYTWSWTSVPAGFTSTIHNPVVSPLVTTTYIVTVTNGPCSATDSVTVIVSPQFMAGSISGTQTVCSGITPAQLTGTAPAGGITPYTYQWQKWNSTASAWEDISGATGLNYQPPALTETTRYRQQQISGGSCGTVTTNEVTITVNPAPATPTVTKTGDSLVSSAPAGNQWFLDGNLITGATGQYYVPSQAGSYQVQVTVNGCSSALSAPVVITGVVENTKESILIYPNPTSGIIHVKAQKINGYRVKVSDICGKILLQSENSSQVDLSGFNAGIYYLIISTDSNVLFTRKIILTK